MTKAIPKWVMQRYSALYREFKIKEFTRDEAKKVISKFKVKDDERLTNTFFSDLSKKGWVETEKDTEDARKKIFRLVSPERAILNLDLGE
jgi:hypothetical protein